LIQYVLYISFTKHAQHRLCRLLICTKVEVTPFHGKCYNRHWVAYTMDVTEKIIQS